MFMPRAVEILTKEIKLKNADIVSSNFYVENAHSVGYVMKAAESPVTWFHGKIYRTKYLTENNFRFRDDLRYNEDSYFNFVVFNCTKNKYNVNEVTYLWRDNQNSLTRHVEIDGTVFFDKSWDQYIRSQIYGLLELEKRQRNLSPMATAATLINIFEHYTIAKFFGYDVVSIKDELHMLSTEWLKEKINTDAFWSYIVMNLKAAFSYEENIIFVREPFSDWLKSFIGEN